MYFERCPHCETDIELGSKNCPHCLFDIEISRKNCLTHSKPLEIDKKNTLKDILIDLFASWGVTIIVGIGIISSIYLFIMMIINALVSSALEKISY